MRLAEPHVVVIAAGEALLEDPPRTVHVNVFAIASERATDPIEAVSWADGRVLPAGPISIRSPKAFPRDACPLPTRFAASAFASCTG